MLHSISNLLGWIKKHIDLKIALSKTTENQFYFLDLMILFLYNI